MYCLAVDTSSKFLTVALINNKKIIKQYHKIQDRQHSVLLLTVIDKILKSSKISKEDIDCFAVDIGPGSFTGLRIAIATIKGLNLALKKPILDISSLDLVAILQDDKADNICSIIDAKRQQVFGAIYKKSKNVLLKKSDYFLGSIDELLKKLKGKVIFCGDAVSLYKSNIACRKQLDYKFAKENRCYPNGESFARLCYDLYRKKRFKKAENIAALYLYKDTCSIRKKKT